MLKVGGTAACSYPMISIGGGDGDLLGGKYVRGIGDINGDGFGDIALSSSSDQRIAYILYGNNQTLANIKSIADYVNGTAAHGLIIQRLNDPLAQATSAGDINNDGIKDIMMSGRAPDHTPGGILYVVYGNGELPNILFAASYITDKTNGFVVMGTSDNRLGYAATALGDVNGDGITDIMLSYNDPNNAELACVLYGKKGGLPNIDSISTYLSDITHGFTIAGPQGMDFNIEDSGGIDINGDGIGDIILLTSRSSDTIPVFIIYGKKGGLSNIKSVDAYLSDTTNGFKVDNLPCDFASNVGDVNVDGIEDITISNCQYREDGSTEGAVYTLYGSRVALPNIQSIISYLDDTSKGFRMHGTDTASLYINPLRAASAGDMNRDGIGDMAMKAIYNTGGEPSGAIYIAYGKKGGLPNIDSMGDYFDSANKGCSVVSQIISFGNSLSTGNNIDGSGKSSLVVGQYDTSNPSQNAYILYSQEGPGPDGGGGGTGLSAAQIGGIVAGVVGGILAGLAGYYAHKHYHAADAETTPINAGDWHDAA